MAGRAKRAKMIKYLGREKCMSLNVSEWAVITDRAGLPGFWVAGNNCMSLNVSEWAEIRDQAGIKQFL
ncbi:predicted protein [Sclerotinia sclerotiorum 1980 UF-70]|uniref:Uncharacterized protein n=1 Tax=Sclerotinia sclerotiorum (strain ATCC 18683 / 1980 / Ss-1) TaxID=665079 RepID=A7EZJ9_SCLS1|nr:predicted protein [Sclerotinia sclerotiorum 1980 UF-70]EDN94891.1 predicted protein [Sclerotinia sclerotiorum 1980 UF-70]